LVAVFFVIHTSRNLSFFEHGIINTYFYRQENNYNHMEENKLGAMKIVTPIATLIIGVVVGFIIGAGQSGSSNAEVARLQAQIETAKKFFPSIPEMHSVPGTIKSISGDTIIIESINTANPFEVLPVERVITITHDTKIVFFEQKDQAVFQKEIVEFSKMIKTIPSENMISGRPPLAFIEKVITQSDLKEGMTVNVEAAENVKEKASFVAVKITASTTMAPVMPPAPQAL